MKARYFAAAVISAFVLAACQPPAATTEPPAVTEPAAGACVVTQSRNWTAHVNAMPGPNAQRTLNVAGEVDLPTPGYTVTLTEGIADRSAIPTQQLNLTVTPPAPGAIVTQVITPTAVTYTGPAIAQSYTAVRIMCEGQQLAEIQVTVAQ